MNQNIDNLQNIDGETINQAIRDFVPNLMEGIAEIPDVIEGAGNYVDAVAPTTNSERMDELYGQGSAGSQTQANLSTADALSTVGMVTGTGAVVKGLGGTIARSVDDAVDGIETPNVNPLDGTETGDTPVKIITVDSDKYPESAQHIDDAQEAGHPSILTVDREGASNNRRDSLNGIPTRTGYDRDEYPPAMFEEGGTGASVRYIDPSDNRGAGSCIGAGCRDVENGDKVIIETTKGSSVNNQSIQYSNDKKIKTQMEKI